MSETMTAKSIAPWFGGKRTMAPIIVRELCVHHQYFEPFCGGLSILMTKAPCRNETANDLHGDLINLARVIADPIMAPMLYDRIQRVVICDALLDDAREALAVIPEDPHEHPLLERAYWYFLASWMGKSGTAGTERQDYQLAVRWTAGGGSTPSRWRGAVESLPAWHRRLQNVVVTRRDAFEIIPRFEDVPHTSIYVDPPYHAATRGKGDSGKYLHEFNHESSLGGPSDHERLHGILAAFRKARVVLSYYDCEEVRRLYAGWTFVECGRQKNLARQNGVGTKLNEAPEVLIVNGPSYTDPRA